ncbi:type II toxin-antitoxin system Phd/YefM family antitoxin [Acidaminobacter hydrogenoformans]|uniref:Prevent-host-death family protein n=1 Tax=Acidaminobacter hydrogenoformans DSM 2784 TaxID=1120920 RepID=A0A1G5S6A4_9FIRM|nr:type II toxin-antitoxin system Phd/YefM family antitoxin [Acidaminobacter hydrogenoformans]SCZ81089.1 prevent-host-death family protein [Acidaminobacter hydrogenoformans DSM 2784]
MSKSVEESVTISATELKKNLGKYLDYVNDNHEVVITKNGEKAVRMTPYLSDYARYELMQVKEKALDYQVAGKKVSYEEFLEISEKSELRMEYIEGEIILMAAPSFKHQELLGMLYMAFRQFISGKACKVILAPFDIRLFKPEIRDPDVCQPDLIIACDTEENLNEKGQYFGVPELVVEILSASTRSKDMTKKLNTYMLSGIKEYWIVDHKHKTVIIYRFDNLQIESYSHYKNEEVACSQIFEGLAISLGALFE